MKKVYAILCLAIASLTQLQAQAPQGFNYQATVRNSSGDLIVNTNVYFKFNVIQGSQTAVPIFTETHYVPTDDLGQVNLVIGQGTANTGIFSELDWSLGSYYLGIELNTGSGYVAMGTAQLLSVPFALYAENSGNSTPTTPNLQSVLAENNSANNQQIKDLLDPTEAQDAVTKAYVDTEILNNVQNIEQVLTQGNDANGLQLKGIADPTDAQDATTKSYVDALSNTQGLMNFNGWDNYQVWQDNTTITLTPNSFVFINANNTTLVFPDGPENCCFGDVIYIYVMQEGSIPSSITLQPNNFPVRTPTDWSTTESFQGSLGSGLNTIINVGDYWMVANFDNEGGISNQVITDQDGNTYDYLTYGVQVWTVDNAKMVTYRDGTPIPQVTDNTEWVNLTTGAWAYYNNDPTKPRLYNWYAVMGIHDNDPNTPNKEFAPEGWHVPSDAEWTTLENYLIANGYNYDGTTTENKIAKAMASTTGWNTSTGTGVPGNDQSLNNDSEFNAVPEGYRSGITSNFQEYGSLAIFWTSSENEDDVDAWRRNLDWDSSALIKYGHWKTSGISVRFVRD
jgi:uncharacterized protein (TIGR02145 family)